MEQLGLLPAQAGVCRDSSYPQRNGNMKPDKTNNYNPLSVALHSYQISDIKNDGKSEIKQKKEECQQDGPSNVMSENVGAHITPLSTRKKVQCY